MVHNYRAPALPVVSAVLASGAVVVHCPSGPVCPSLVLPVPFLSFRYPFIVAVVRPWAVGSLMAGLVMLSRCWGGGVSREWWLVIRWRCWGILCLPGMHAVPGLIVARRRGGGCSVVPCSLSPGAHHRHQRRSTRHPPHEQLLVGLEVGGVMVLGPVGSFAVVWVCWCRCRRWHLCWIVIVGPWCLFLIVVGARHHPLALPNLQADACSSGNG
jgi:hypothetical protein